MRVTVIHLEGPGALSRAFDRILAHSDVASCMIEPEKARIRFLAPDSIAEALIEAIYREGGLLWSTRHALAEPKPTVVPSTDSEQPGEELAPLS